ncbi:hypothetical protein AAC387_Pa03g3554 [Persea americana]
MGSFSKPDLIQIPIIDFSKEPKALVRGTEGWHLLSQRVREACETYGCFEVVYAKISAHQRAEMFSAIESLFDLPLETKRKTFSTNPYVGYAIDVPHIPLYESFGIEDASSVDSIKHFTDLMWPTGNDHFSQSISSMVGGLEELDCIIRRMILDSYSLLAEDIIPCKYLVRGTKYKAPSMGDYSMGLYAHTDKYLLTILAEEQVRGLEVLSKDGQWIPLSPSPNSFVVLVGDLFMAWSNGRLRSAKHRAMIQGFKDRFSFVSFAVPTEGTVIQAPQKLVDQPYPRAFKDFDSMNFIRFSYSEEARGLDSDKQVYAYAGI